MTTIATRHFHCVTCGRMIHPSSPIATPLICNDNPDCYDKTPLRNRSWNGRAYIPDHNTAVPCGEDCEDPENREPPAEWHGLIDGFFDHEGRPALNATLRIADGAQPAEGVALAIATEIPHTIIAPQHWRAAGVREERIRWNDEGMSEAVAAVATMRDRAGRIHHHTVAARLARNGATERSVAGNDLLRRLCVSIDHAGRRVRIRTENTGLEERGR